MDNLSLVYQDSSWPLKGPGGWGAAEDGTGWCRGTEPRAILTYDHKGWIRSWVWQVRGRRPAVGP